MTGGLVRLLWRDESGQDMLEYGLLAVIIAIAGILVFPSIVDKLSDNYSDSNTAIQDHWEPCPPGGCP
jgi:Flp pilus assembly pilin Flp